MWIRRFNPLALAAALALASILILSGCSRIRLAYGSADFLLARYAEGYLGLDSGQRERLEPELQRVLALHRREELPRLAAFFDRALQASRGGFPLADTACLVDAFRDLYQRHAGLAVELAVPLLADLGPTQVQALEVRFDRDLAEDLSPTGTKERELHRRARRYQKAIEEWTGPLTADQAVLVEDLTSRMPDTRDAIIDYRTRKRAELIALLRSGAGAAPLRDFLSAWLVDYQDLSPTLRQAGDLLEERVKELVSSLGKTLTQEQRAHLERRLSGLRGDLLKLQSDPRLAPLSC
jgi:hypothetical protein